MIKPLQKAWSHITYQWVLLGHLEVGVRTGDLDMVEFVMVEWLGEKARPFISKIRANTPDNKG